MFGSLNCPAPKALDFGDHKPGMVPVGPQQNVKQFGQLKKPSKPQFVGTLAHAGALHGRAAPSVLRGAGATTWGQIWLEA